MAGTYVTDYPAFFCAIGEAVNGPGGYYGFDINSLIDCLQGGFGATSPYTLVWKKYKRELSNKLLNKPEFEELGQIYSDADISYHQIELIQFAFCNNFKEHLLKSKESINRLVYICTIDKDKNPIGKYSFFIFDNLYYHKVGFPEQTFI
ncbi:barstar family protein [Brevibacillus laterosporus]|uniref:barstar family protein n=1 Tax=Brevibacillus laterosporus TaxID=1465 RepID=UPI003D1C030C